MSEPETMAGRALLLRSRNPTDQLHISREALVPAVLVIESEARAQERARLRAAVDKLFSEWPEMVLYGPSMDAPTKADVLILFDRLPI